MIQTTTEGPRLSKAALFRRLGYAPHEGQLLVHRSRAPRRVLACGARWGKSTCAAMECAAAILEPGDGTLGWVVSATYELTARVFDRVVAALTARCPHRIVKIERRSPKLVVRNLGGGLSTLASKSADNPVSLLGEGIDFLVVDEAARLAPEIWTGHLAQRLVDRKGWALLLSTPRGRDWFFRMYRRGGREPGYEAWASPSWANPHLDPELVEAERATLPDLVFRQEFGAEFHGEDLEPCELCHGPDAKLPRLILVKGATVLPRCRECGQIVDDEGRTRVSREPNGKGISVVVRTFPRIAS